MKLLEKERLENCLPSAPEYRCRFSQPWSAAAIERLRGLGQLEYYPDFPRPFFRVLLRGGLQMKGVQGDCCCRLILRPGEEARQLDEFDGLLAACFAGDPDIKEDTNGSSSTEVL